MLDHFAMAPHYSTEYTGALMIDWATAPDETVTGYRILRSATEEGPFELVGEASIATFMDTLVEPGETYCYAVQSYNTNTLSEQSPALGGALSPFELFLPVAIRQ